PVERTQEAQIEAVRALIVYQVDAIAFTPLVESGWDNVLREAKSASVPLLSIDRAIRGVDDVPLQHIGFDYASLAEQAADALLQQRMPRDGVLELYGTVNASDAREIARGCRASLEEHGLTVTYSLCGDGMRSRGCEILEEMEDHLDEIGYIFAQNDAMALGAVDYLHSHGRKPGKDVLICVCEVRARALRKREVAVIGALDDTQLAELTADAAQQIAKAPWKPYIALADTAVLTEEGTADA
ncbi:MAG: substrate-binding domain-containing protein, partial [Butyricicoccus sp.]